MIRNISHSSFRECYTALAERIAKEFPGWDIVVDGGSYRSYQCKFDICEKSKTIKIDFYLIPYIDSAACVDWLITKLTKAMQEIKSGCIYDSKENAVYDSKTGLRLVEKGGKTTLEKYCGACKTWKPVETFHKYPGKSGYAWQCKECMSLYNKEYRAKQKKEELSLNGNVQTVVQPPLLKPQEPSSRLLYVVANMTREEIITLLSSPQITTDMLFNEIAKRDGRYRFFAKDIISGQTYPKEHCA